jgi:hypothetical protein
LAYAADLSYLQKWHKKYPLDKINNHTLFSLPVFKKELASILGTKEYQKLRPLIKGTHTETVVSKYNNTLHFFLCEPHNCSNFIFYFYIDLGLNELSICEKIDSHIVWFGSLKNKLGIETCDLYPEDK